MATKQNMITFDVSIKTMERVFDAGWGHDERYALLCNVIADAKDNTLAKYDSVIVVKRDTKVRYVDYNNYNNDIAATAHNLYAGFVCGARGNSHLTAQIVGYRTTNGTFTVKEIIVEAEVFDGWFDGERRGDVHIRHSLGYNTATPTAIATREMINIDAHGGTPARFAIIPTGDANRPVLLTVQKSK